MTCQKVPFECTLQDCFARFLHKVSSQPGLLDGKSDQFGDTGTVFGINLVKVLNHAFLDIATALAKASSHVGDSLLTHSVVENVAEESTRLLIIGVGVLVGVATSLASHAFLLPGVDTVLNRRSSD